MGPQISSGVLPTSPAASPPPVRSDRLRLCLSVLALEAEFGSHVFSADMVARGKPHPDIFLFAASRLGVRPDQCLVIEDSAGGIRAAVAAGMTAVGLCAASHIREGHDLRLRDAGAPAPGAFMAGRRTLRPSLFQWLEHTRLGGIMPARTAPRAVARCIIDTFSLGTNVLSALAETADITNLRSEAAGRADAQPDTLKFAEAAHCR